MVKELIGKIVPLVVILSWLAWLTVHPVAHVPSHEFGDGNFGARGPATINGQDAGSYPAIILPAAIPTTQGAIQLSNDISGDASAPAVVSMQSGEVSCGKTTGTLTCAASATGCGVVQASTTTSPGATSVWQPQSCITTASCVSGNAQVVLTPPVSPATTEPYLEVDRVKGTHYFLLGGYQGAGGGDAAMYVGVGATSSLTYLAIDSFSAGTIYFNGHTSASLSIDDIPQLTADGSYIYFVQPLRGASGHPLVMSNSPIALGTSGTTTLSTVQASTPRLILTSGTLSGSVTLDFGTNGVTGFWMANISGVGIGATYGLVLKNGSASCTYLTTTQPTGSGLVLIETDGANSIVCN
jgi:hypothetical protein